MRKRLMMAVLAFLPGCQTKDVHQMSYTQQKAWAAAIVQSCKDQKVPEIEMQACIIAESKRDAGQRYESRERARAVGQSLAAGMSNMGAQMQANSTYRPQTQCTSRLAGTFVGQPNRVETTCY